MPLIHSTNKIDVINFEIGVIEVYLRQIIIP